MDNGLLLSDEVQEFIKAHEYDDLNKLVLQRDKYPKLPLVAIVEQIKARKKAKLKLPTWYNSEGILFPHPVSIEQSSSEITAKWKADYIGPGKSGIDLTGGFGVDSHYFSINFEHWTHVEPNAELQAAALHNATKLSIKNTVFANLQSEEYINHIKESVDFIYLDPDRRPSEMRVAGFKDSQPDITGLLPQLKEVAPQILIKASPMIDISAGLADLEATKRVIVLGINNEVKEILFHLDFNSSASLKIRCVNIKKDNIETFEYDPDDAKQEVTKISAIDSCLLEPNATIMKSGGQDILACQYGLAKLHRNTNLYTAPAPVAQYPGRVFKVVANINYSKKELSGIIDNPQANLSARNFIDTPEQMKKKLKLKDGGSIYIFGYRDSKNRNKLAVCSKV
jgi:hypothetical protein